MKKKLITILSTCAMLFVASCANDEDYYMKGIHSNERSILTLVVPGQIGMPVITKTDAESKVEVYVFAGTDLTAVTPNIQVSYKAKISPASGETVNFASNGNHYAYTVTSESGDTRVWDVSIKEFQFDLGGVWKVAKYEYYYHVAPSETWGWAGTKEMKWVMPNAADADDDTFEFVLEGATADGNVYGTFKHHVGADGKVATYVHDSQNGPYDFAYKFNKLPVEDGKWELNFATSTITFNKGLAGQVTTMALEWQNDKNRLLLPFNPGPSDPKWDNDWTSDEIHFSEKFWYTLDKVE